ncbi:alpha-amylase [Balneolaceae bacterium ANBcel3]|nr:alpha-amylase [Balneolaceae bacterium ANBcel3]
MKEYNGAMMQFFHWYTPADGSLWNQLSSEASALADAGITSLWLPPAYKGNNGGLGVGYAVYDLFDLGEFDQKGSVRTKYGTKNEYIQAIQTAQKAGLRVYADIVLNHKIGADGEETFRATPFHPDNRMEAMGPEEEIKAWTYFSFPGRDGKYSSLHWHWWHFNAVDYNALDQEKKAVYLIEGKSFHDDVDTEKGNFDYLMGCNLDMNNPDVRKELIYWGKWYLDTTGVDGFRFDAVKHVSPDFFPEWMNAMKEHTGKDLFSVAEYWSGDSQAKDRFLNMTGKEMMLFDVNLHYRFASAGREKTDFDLQTIFDNTLVSHSPDLAVTLVSNHDTQPLQSLESVVEPWFKPLAYALILLRKGGYPCIFSADYYGAEYTDHGRDGKEHTIIMPSHRWLIDHFLAVRKKHAFGEQYDYFDHPNCVGWTRTGNDAHPGGIAVVISNSKDGFKDMETTRPDTTYFDVTGHVDEKVVTNENGWGKFYCKEASVSVWIPEPS